jgi:hypothetical protein
VSREPRSWLDGESPCRRSAEVRPTSGSDIQFHTPRLGGGPIDGHPDLRSSRSALGNCGISAHRRARAARRGALGGHHAGGAETASTRPAGASAVPADASPMTPVATSSVAWGRTSPSVAISVAGPGPLTARRLRRRATREDACRLATSAARTPVGALLAAIAAANALVARPMRASLSMTRIFCRRCGRELQYDAPQRPSPRETVPTTITPQRNLTLRAHRSACSARRRDERSAATREKNRSFLSSGVCSTGSRMGTSTAVVSARGAGSASPVARARTHERGTTMTM